MTFLSCTLILKVVSLSEQGRVESQASSGKDALVSTPKKSSSKSSVRSKSSKTSLKSVPTAANVPETSPEVLTMPIVLFQSKTNHSLKIFRLHLSLNKNLK